MRKRNIGIHLVLELNEREKKDTEYDISNVPQMLSISLTTPFILMVLKAKCLKKGKYYPGIPSVTGTSLPRIHVQL